MVFDKIADLFKDYGTRPNKFTLHMGEQIRKARLEAGLSQEELAEKIYMRRPTLTDIENGKSEPNASSLGLITFFLKKPLSYFYPPQLYEEVVTQRMDDLSVEMQMYFEEIDGDELKELAIDLIKQFAEFDITELVVNSAELVAGRIEHDEEIQEVLKRHSKRGKKE
ncbi:MAG: helix-turn-helix transcriptional regulator [Chloroflexota bacterium]|nr:helix-turn-helix transcriptional regulator [Chloroflexota bacterium]